GWRRPARAAARPALFRAAPDPPPRNRDGHRALIGLRANDRLERVGGERALEVTGRPLALHDELHLAARDAGIGHLAARVVAALLRQHLAHLLEVRIGDALL